ncbi:hypothetical protein JCM4814A_00990 [Streptomyces phaeofaciens JCM 4814]|uniref:Uncharacterized protein n=1 Tax=Streptomyces phaeofaciens TaxID=68254 RepID=A0A918M0B8_9ACTN|nr:hypothetical protein GCM10010226_82590 [Streptomyces phaeofaciens]
MTAPHLTVGEGGPLGLSVVFGMRALAADPRLFYATSSDLFQAVGTDLQAA